MLLLIHCLLLLPLFVGVLCLILVFYLVLRFPSKFAIIILMGKIELVTLL